MAYTGLKQKPAKRGFAIFCAVLSLAFGLFAAVGLIMCKTKYDFILNADRQTFKEVSFVAQESFFDWDYTIHTPEGDVLLDSGADRGVYFEYIGSSLRNINRNSHVIICYMAEQSENGSHFVVGVIENGYKAFDFDRIYNDCQQQISDRTIAMCVCLLAFVLCLCITFAIKPQKITYEDEKANQKYLELKQEYEKKVKEQIAQKVAEYEKETIHSDSFWADLFGLNSDYKGSYTEWGKNNDAKVLRATQKPAETPTLRVEQKHEQAKQTSSTQNLVWQKPSAQTYTKQIEQPVQKQAEKPVVSNVDQKPSELTKVVHFTQPTSRQQSCEFVDQQYQRQNQTRQSAKYKKFKQSMGRASGKYVAKLFASRGDFAVIMQAVSDVMFDGEFRVVYDARRGDSFAFAFYKNNDKLFCKQVYKNNLGLFFVDVSVAEWSFPQRQQMTPEQKEIFKKCLKSYQWFSPDEICF